MRIPLGLVLVGVLSTAGCGEGEKSASSTPTPTPTATASATPTAEGPSEKEWAAKVTTVCERNQKLAEGLVADAQAKGLQGNELAAEVLDRSVPVQRRMVGQLADVEAPAAISEDYNFFVERLRQSLPLLEQLADAIRDNDQKAGAVLEPQLKDLAADTRPFAMKHDLRACLPDQS